jgi:hypothetical protein
MCRKIIKLSLVFVSIYGIFLNYKSFADGTARISSFVGDVSIERDNRKIAARIGDAVQDGDIIHIKGEAMIVLSLSDSDMLTITGPRTFRVRSDHLKRDVERSSILGRFSKVFDRNVPRCSQTVVIGVRGLRGVRSARGRIEIDRATREDIKEATNAYSNGDYDKALRIFKDINKRRDIHTQIKANCQFFMAEIFFKKMEYRDALVLFQGLYQLDEKIRFRYRELSHARSIICCDYTGEYELMKKLANEYFNKYGDEGKFSDLVKEIIKRG